MLFVSVEWIRDHFANGYSDILISKKVYIFKIIIFLLFYLLLYKIIYKKMNSNWIDCA